MDPDLIRRILAAIQAAGIPGIPRSGGATPITQVAPELGRGALDFGTQTLRGLGTTGIRIPEGVARIAGKTDFADRLQREREQLDEFYGQPETGYGVAGSAVGTIAPFIAGAAAGGSSVPGMLGSIAALDIPAEASGRDFSVLGAASDILNEGKPSPLQYELNRAAENPLARGLVGGAFAGGAGLLSELLPSAKAARTAEREAKAAAEKAALERTTSPLPPLLKDADQAAIDKILKAREVEQRGKVDVPYSGPERRAPSRLDSNLPTNELDVPNIKDRRIGAVDPVLLRGIARTGVGALGGGAAASGEGGLNPVEGALIGAGLVNLPAASRALRGARRGATEAAVEGATKVAEHPTLISDLKPKVKDDYNVTISALAGKVEDVPEVVARAERVKPDLTPKYTRGRAEREALAAEVPVEDVLAKPSNAPLNDVDNEVLRVNYNRNQAELNDLYTKQATTVDAVEQDQIVQRINQLEGVQDQIIGKRVPTASEAGRALASLRAQFDAESPLAWIQKSQKILGRSLTTAETEEVNALIKAGKQGEASQYIQGLLDPLTPKDIEFWTTFRKGSLLSSGVSIGRALVGNTTNVAFNAASRPATVILDTMASLLRSGSPTAARSTSVRGTGRQLFEGAKGALSGVPEGARIIASGLDDAAAAKMELRQGSRLRSPLGFDVPKSVRQKLPKGVAPQRIDAVDMWTQFWLRAQGAADRPYRNAVIKASNAELAQLTARKEGLKGAEYKARVQHLIDNPTAEMGILSNLRADHISFQGESFLTDIGAKLKTAASASEKVGTRSIARSPVIRGTVEMVQPFTRTPGAIVQQNLEATPFGGVGFLMDVRRLAKAAGKEDEKLATEIQRRMASRGGRAITGSIIGIWLGGKWYSEGKMLATAPESGSDRTQFFDAGKSPFSVKLGNRWTSLAQLGPAGAAVSFGAMLAKQADEEGKTVSQLVTDPLEKYQAGDITGAAKDVASGLGTLGQGAVQTTAQLALETPFLTGTKEVLDALQDPSGTFGEKAINTAASFVPNLAASRARATDPVVRSPEGLIETAKTRIPGQSQDVKPSLMAVSGQPKLRESPETEQNYFQAILGSSPDRTLIDPVIAEMESVGASAGRLSKQKGESEEDYFRRQQATGQVVITAIDAFKNPTDPTSQQILQTLGINPAIAQVYAAVKGRDPNDPQVRTALIQLGEFPGFPADAENAGDILEYVISKARGFTTSTIRKARAIR